MRRIDAIGIGFGVFVAGGMGYLVLKIVGLDDLQAGVWSQVLLICVVIGWVSTYLFRVVTRNMTYGQQLREYQDAVLQKRLDEMSPEALAKLQAEIEQEKSGKSSDS